MAYVQAPPGSQLCNLNAFGCNTAVNPRSALGRYIGRVAMRAPFIGLGTPAARGGEFNPIGQPCDPNFVNGQWCGCPGFPACGAKKCPANSVNVGGRCLVIPPPRVPVYVSGLGNYRIHGRARGQVRTLGKAIGRRGLGDDSSTGPDLFAQAAALTNDPSVTAAQIDQLNAINNASSVLDPTSSSYQAAQQIASFNAGIASAQAANKPQPQTKNISSILAQPIYPGSSITVGTAGIGAIGFLTFASIINSGRKRGR
jgi:hypothetical protein